MNAHSVPESPCHSHPSNRPQRDCGPCTACCTTMFVRDLHKPAGVPCKFLTPKGCGVYQHRWDVCKGFVCMWLRDHHGLFSEQHRPDRLGLILTGKTDPDTQQMHFTAHEVWPHAADGPQARHVIAFLGQFGPVRTIPAAQPAPHVKHEITLTVNGKVIEPPLSRTA